jgi:ferrous iron transport protein A
MVEKSKDTITLNNVKIGASVVVTNIIGERKFRRHLYDMGVTIGTSIFVRKVAPLGDPIEVTLRNYELTLRKREAQNIFCVSGAK